MLREDTNRFILIYFLKNYNTHLVSNSTFNHDGNIAFSLLKYPILYWWVVYRQ